MNSTLEERVAALENELAELRQLMLAGVRVPPQDAWRETFGSMKDDPHFDAAMRAGAEWRAGENARAPDAAS